MVDIFLLQFIIYDISLEGLQSPLMFQISNQCSKAHHSFQNNNTSETHVIPCLGIPTIVFDMILLNMNGCVYCNLCLCIYNIMNHR
jgi:hypothetical protein